MGTATLSNVPTAIDLAESITNWAGDTFALEPDDKIQGSNSVSTTLTPNTGNSQEIWVAGSWDFSGDVHLRLPMKITWAGNLQTEANGGIQIFISDGTNSSYWTIWGSDTYPGGWQKPVVYTGLIPDETVGVVNKSAITKIGYRFKAASKPRNVPANSWFDAWYYGDGYTVTGGTSGDEIDWSHVAALDKTAGYGIVELYEGNYLFAGRVEVGDGISTTYFKSPGQHITFKDMLVSPFLYALVFTDSGSLLTNIDIQGGTIKSAGTRFTLDASIVCNSFTMNGLQISYAGATTLHDGAVVTNTAFDNCNQVDPKTATFQNNSIFNSTDLLAALKWPTSGNTSKCTFANNDKSVEVNQTTNQTFVDMVFDDVSGKYDVLLNNGGVSIEIAKNGTSNPNSYTTIGGGVVTFTGVRPPITVIVTDETSGELLPNARVYIEAGSTGSMTPGDVILGPELTGADGSVTSTVPAAPQSYVGLVADVAESNYYYVPKPFSGTITTTAGTTINISLVRDQ